MNIESLGAFADMLERVRLGGIISECVVVVKNGRASVQAMDMTSTIFVSTSTEFPFEDCALGIGNIDMLVKYAQTYGDVPIDVTHQENKLIMKPEKGSVMRYLLSQADLVPTYEFVWEEEPPMEKLMSLYKEPITMPTEKIGMTVKLMKVITPNIMSVRVNPKGRLSFVGGVDTDHQFKVDFGITSLPECDAKLYGKSVLPILSYVQGMEDVQLYVHETEPITFEIPDTLWAVGRIKDAR